MRVNTYDLILLIFEFLLYSFHITVTIFLFCDKSKKFNEAFFNIIKIIFVADLLFLLANVFGRLPRFGLWPEFFLSNGWLAALIYYSYNYLAFLQFIGQTILAFNRFTALLLPVKHAKIWRYQWYTIAILILPFAPILAQLPVKGEFLYYADGSVSARIFPDSVQQKSFLITNAIFCSTTALGILINILAAFKFYSLKKTHGFNENNNSNSKEAHLFYMSFILFIYQCCRCAYNYSKLVFLDNKEVSSILGIVLPYFSDAHAALGNFSLLFMSPSTRKSYIKFWTCSKIILKGSKISTAHQLQQTSRNNVTRIQ